MSDGRTWEHPKMREGIVCLDCKRPYRRSRELLMCDCHVRHDDGTIYHQQESEGVPRYPGESDKALAYRQGVEDERRGRESEGELRSLREAMMQAEAEASAELTNFFEHGEPVDGSET